MANLSATDLECLFRKQFFRLFMPVVDYIKAVYADKKEVRGRWYISRTMIGPDIPALQIMTPPLSVTPEATLETLILKFAGTRFHSCYFRALNAHSFTDCSFTTGAECTGSTWSMVRASCVE